MTYGPKWIEEHLGITTSAIKGYEKKGLIRTFGGKQYNKGNKVRQYDAEDLETMWLIKVLQSIGFTLKEISNMKDKPEDNFSELLELKIQQLEADIAIRDYFLGYAKEIKLTGRIPIFPKELGRITWNEYHNRIINEWNIHTNAQSKDMIEDINSVIDVIENGANENNLLSLLVRLSKTECSPEKFASGLLNESIIKHIIRKKDKGADHPEIQMLVSMLYEEYLSSADPDLEVNPQKYGRIMSSAYVVGDISLIDKQKYGEENCLFIADAIAIFGGYENFEDSQIVKPTIIEG